MDCPYGNEFGEDFDETDQCEQCINDNYGTFFKPCGDKWEDDGGLEG